MKRRFCSLEISGMSHITHSERSRNLKRISSIPSACSICTLQRNSMPASCSFDVNNSEGNKAAVRNFYSVSLPNWIAQKYRLSHQTFKNSATVGTFRLPGFTMYHGIFGSFDTLTSDTSQVFRPSIHKAHRHKMLRSVT
jgi:hypothetical protein